MKIRNGFVSNSSSSSFCILGFSLKDIDEEGLLSIAVGMLPEDMSDWKKHDLVRDKAKKDRILEVREGSFAPLIGIVVAEGTNSDDGGYLEEKELDYYEFQALRKQALEMREKIISALAKMTPGKMYNYPEIKLYIGSMAC